MIPQELKSNPSLVKCLDISTAHLTMDEVKLLDEASCSCAFMKAMNPVTVHKYEEGYFVHVPTETSTYLTIAKFGYGKQFVDILRRAKELGCTYVQFDGDGTQYNDLQTYSW
jgi:hypothetical protein